MKLLVATPIYPPEIGGPATYAKILSDGLPKSGIEVKLVKFSEVRHLPKVIRHYAYYRRVLAAARTADIVLALDPVSVGLPAMFAAKKAKKPFVVKIVGDYAWEQGQQRFGIMQTLDAFVHEKRVPIFVNLLKKIQTRVVRSATRIVVPSEYLKGIIASWGIDKEKISVIYNGINIPQSIPVIQKKAGEFLIVSAGRCVPWKGFDAIERVAAGHANWRVFIASGLSREETLGWIRAADVFVLNSLYEGLSHVLIEAMTIGTPVVATSVGGNPELVSDGETGLLIHPSDDTALLKALADVENNPTLAKARAVAGQKRMMNFSVTHMLAETAKLLTKI